MEFWYQSKLPWFAFLLLPFAILIKAISRHKRENRRKSSYSVPVLVVGNITVGGTGKTPMIQYLARLCARNGISVGIVSRGYGGLSKSYPLLVTEDTSASECGDEPKLLHHTLKVPVVVAPDRHLAVKHLVQNTSVELIISDDGLQHYNMARDIELVMLDGQRGLGNNHLLPLGPLRESNDRLTHVDFILSKGRCELDQTVDAEAELIVSTPINYLNQPLPKDCELALVTAIGHGQNFLKSIESLGYSVGHATFLKDHAFISSEILNKQCNFVVTEKDAIKLKLSQHPNVYVASLSFKLPTRLDEQLIDLIREKIDEKSSHYPRSV
jgi:tetraacyldisaccharide 4'-kinase